MDYAQQLADFAHILEQKRLVTALEGNASVIDRQSRSAAAAGARASICCMRPSIRRGRM